MTRMTQFKDKKTQFRDQNKTNYIPTGLLVYPILMAADILLYDAHLVPVGDDQTQHLELTRNLAVRFNNKFQKNLFTVPEKLTPLIGGRIMDLQNPLQKMSKSSLNENGCIYLLDDLDQIAKKIKRAVTDSDNTVKYDMIKKPGVSNLMTIYACLTKLTFNQIENKFRDCHYGQFKNALISELLLLIEKIQKKYQSYCDSPQLNDIIIKGQTRANLVSDEKIKQVKRVMGLARELYPSKT